MMTNEADAITRGAEGRGDRQRQTQGGDHHDPLVPGEARPHRPLHHSGWNPEPDLFASNQDFEVRPLDRVTIGDDLAAFCRAHFSRMPHQYWHGPLPPARDYVRRHPPPWA
ncbi:hypothetical protein [Micromonospora sp. WMMD998]|uniref:hypothetical protein n=1 Tax=Micromonospora sp. WMMD998 TaxID=3016092 RepID=UPI00249A85F0|nr:hypothetical protein [Micromonospora sp. WMMD998]WFE42751.1 hypothetical protein O7619_25990 [Micromonospora sp. WMMD998]